MAARVLEHIDDRPDALVAEVQELVRVPSVSGSDEENEIQARLADRVGRLGMDVDHWKIDLDHLACRSDFPGMEVERREAWGLVARLPGRGGGRSLMLNGHVDVVPTGDVDQWPERAPFSGAIRGGDVLGRGTCDMKAGVVAAVWVAQAVAACDVPLAGDLLIALVQGEEDGGLGTYATLDRGWRADACVIPEPTGLALVPANGGSLTFRLRVRGRAAHASRRTAGVSAVEKFGPVLAALRRLEAERNRDPDPLMRRWDVAYPIEVGRVAAGDWASSVPDLLVADGRLGVALGEDPAEAEAALEAAMAEASAADPWLAAHPVEVEWWGGRFAPGTTPLESPILGHLARAHLSVTGAPAGSWGAPYGSDLRLLTGIGGMPTVQYGPGDVSVAHGPGERVPVDDVLTATRVLSLLALDWCGVAQ
ncbi:MAG: ArgE/DapE family deacylase [Acidimicrobiales bacterium]